MIPGMGMPDKVLSLLGGDAKIIGVGTEYTRIFLFYSAVLYVKLYFQCLCKK